MLHSYGERKIEILEFHEGVRRRPKMYIGSTDSQGLHMLLQFAVEHILFHYHFLGYSLDTIQICLEDDGSATLISKGPEVATTFLEGSDQFREIDRRARLRLSIVSALCERLRVTARGPDNHWRSLLFEQGVLRRDESHPPPSGEEGDIWLRIFPDFTLLKPGVFDSQHTRELMRPLAESHSTVTFTVIDARPQKG